jgi:hypothetical protein
MRACAFGGRPLAPAVARKFASGALGLLLMLSSSAALPRPYTKAVSPVLTLMAVLLLPRAQGAQEHAPKAHYAFGGASVLGFVHFSVT